MDSSAAGELAKWNNEISFLYSSGYFTPPRTDLEMEIKPVIRILSWKSVEKRSDRVKVFTWNPTSASYGFYFESEYQRLIICKPCSSVSLLWSF